MNSKNLFIILTILILTIGYSKSDGTSCAEREYKNGNLTIKAPGADSVPYYKIVDGNKTFEVILSDLYEIENDTSSNWQVVSESRVDLLALNWEMRIDINTDDFTYVGTGSNQFDSITIINRMNNGNDDGVCRYASFNECSQECNNTCQTMGSTCSNGCKVFNVNNYDNSSECISGCNENDSFCRVACKEMYKCLVNKCTTNLKFDLIVKNYNWISRSNTSKLVLEYEVIGKGKSQSVTNDTFSFGDLWVYFNQTSFYLPNSCDSCSESCICGPTNLVQSQLMNTTDNDNKLSIFFTYDHFPMGTTLLNDPIFGLYNNREVEDRVTVSVSEGNTLQKIPLFLFISIVSILLFF